MSSLLLKSIQINRDLQSSRSLELEQQNLTVPTHVPKPRPKKTKVRKYATFEDAATAAQKLNISTSQAYTENYKRDPLLPANPMEYYADFKDKGAWDTYLNRVGGDAPRVRRQRNKLGSCGLLPELSIKPLTHQLSLYEESSNTPTVIVALALFERIRQYYAVIDYKKRPVLTLSYDAYCSTTSVDSQRLIYHTFQTAVALDRHSALGLAAWEVSAKEGVDSELLYEGLQTAMEKVDDPTFSGMYWDLNNSMSRSRMVKVIDRVIKRLRLN